MKRKTIWIAGAAAAAVALGTGAGIAAAGGGDDGNGSPITGPALAKASATALAHTGEGRVTATEVNDEEGYYEIEVRLDNGHSVDVHLDRSFHVIGSGADREGDGNDAGGG